MRQKKEHVVIIVALLVRQPCLQIYTCSNLDILQPKQKDLTGGVAVNADVMGNIPAMTYIQPQGECGWSSDIT